MRELSAKKVDYRLETVCDLLADRGEDKGAAPGFFGKVLDDAFGDEYVEFDGHPVVAGDVLVEFGASATGMVTDVQDDADHMGIVEKQQLVAVGHGIVGCCLGALAGPMKVFLRSERAAWFRFVLRISGPFCKQPLLREQRPRQRQQQLR